MKKYTIQKATPSMGGWWVMRGVEFFEWYTNIAAAKRALEALQPPIECTVKVSEAYTPGGLAAGWLCVKHQEGGWTPVFRLTPHQIEEWKKHHGK